MWTDKQLKHKQQEGKIRGYTYPQKNIPHKKKNNIPSAAVNRSKEKDWLGWNLLYWANEHTLELCTEYLFDEKRKWRFDWALPAIKVAVEYEGIISEKSRHTTIGGFTGDAEKYNRAQQLGWRLIRLTALNYKTVLKTLDAYVA